MADHSLTSDPAIDQLIAAFYAAFDNRERSPDGVALRAMFAEGARITRVDARGATSWDVDGFIAPRVAMLATGGALTGFHEWETDAATRIAGRIASRQSRYAKSGVMNGLAYQGGGQKFIQLCRGESGWKIVSILWEDDETN